jgi:hypothetical protein
MRAENEDMAQKANNTKEWASVVKHTNLLRGL